MTVISIVIIAIFAGAGLGVGAYFLLRKRQRIENIIEYESVETLTLELVVIFFKQPDVLKILKEDKNLLAVATKDDVAKAIVLCCFDKEKNVMITDKCKGYKYQTLSNDLIKMFGNKDMLVLQ